MSTLATALLAVLLPFTALAEIIPIRGTPPGLREDRHAVEKVELYGFDSKTGAVAWIVLRHREANFLEAFPEGALVGFDDGTLVLLDTQTGKAKWDILLGTQVTPINTFRGRYENGYLVSQRDSKFWFVSRDGKLVWQQPPAKK